MLAVRIHGIFSRLTDDQREDVLIIDDSTYDRSRSKKVELLSRVFDHSTGRYLRGFRLLTVCWSDGISSLPLDFALLSSAKAKNRYQEATKQVDKRCCAYRRRQEATMKATEHLGPMVERILKAGIKARYVLMDRWFTMPPSFTWEAPGCDWHAQKTSKILTHRWAQTGSDNDLPEAAQRPGQNSGLTHRNSQRSGAGKDRVRSRPRKTDWLALLSTDIHLPDEDVVRIYGKRWDIEVLFKMAKQHLKLAKEIQCRDFDALIAHTTLVFMRYMFLIPQCRIETDHRTFGDLFYRCCDEVNDISFIEALYRVLSLAVAQLRAIDNFCEKTAFAFFDAIMNTALQCVGLSKNKLVLKPES